MEPTQGERVCLIESHLINYIMFTHHKVLCLAGEYKSVPKKMLLGQKFPISKKSLKVALHSRNLVKMTTSCANHFDKVLWLLEKNCDFSIYTKIWI